MDWEWTGAALRGNELMTFSKRATLPRNNRSRIHPVSCTCPAQLLQAAPKGGHDDRKHIRSRLVLLDPRYGRRTQRTRANGVRGLESCDRAVGRNRRSSSSGRCTTPSSARGVGFVFARITASGS
jgi:hypothetical protein